MHGLGGGRRGKESDRREGWHTDTAWGLSHLRALVLCLSHAACRRALRGLPIPASLGRP
jgi:hypothetical protein